jgi:hypothetical protein
MTLNATGAISLAGTTTGQSIEVELGGNGTTQISLNDTNVRTLAGVASGAISLSNFYGKSNATYFIGGININSQGGEVQLVGSAPDSSGKLYIGTVTALSGGNYQQYISVINTSGALASYYGRGQVGGIGEYFVGGGSWANLSLSGSTILTVSQGDPGRYINTWTLSSTGSINKYFNLPSPYQQGYFLSSTINANGNSALTGQIYYVVPLGCCVSSFRQAAIFFILDSSGAIVSSLQSTPAYCYGSQTEAVTSDSSSNFYVSLLNNNLDAYGFYIHKFSSSGTFSTATLIKNGTIAFQYIWSMCTDANNLYVAASDGNGRNYIISLTLSSLSLNWMYMYYNTSWGNSASVATDGSGNVYWTMGNAIGIPSVLVTKLNSSGTVQWSNQLAFTLFQGGTSNRGPLYSPFNANVKGSSLYITFNTIAGSGAGQGTPIFAAVPTDGSHNTSGGVTFDTTGSGRVYTFNYSSYTISTSSVGSNTNGQSNKFTSLSASFTNASTISLVSQTVTSGYATI